MIFVKISISFLKVLAIWLTGVYLGKFMMIIVGILLITKWTK